MDHEHLIDCMENRSGITKHLEALAKASWKAIVSADNTNQESLDQLSVVEFAKLAGKCGLIHPDDLKTMYQRLGYILAE